jgi:hypothetical protein
MAVQLLDTNYYGTAIALEGDLSRDEVLTFTAAATVLKGTLLARVTSTGKLKPFVVGASDGTQTPTNVLTYDVAATAAGDVAIRTLAKGVVNRNRLIIAADGNGNNITPAILDQLRVYGITPIDVQDVGQIL